MDLKGQLSNPREKLETLDLQGSQVGRRRRAGLPRAVREAPGDPDPGPNEEVGRYSNPSSSGPTRQAQPRLKPDEIDALLAAYRADELVRDIAARFGVSRTTVVGHVTRHGLPHRRDRGWAPTDLATAADLYASGHSLAEVGQREHRAVAMPIVVIDGALVDSLADLYDVISTLLMPDVDWKVSNLDGFNDILRGGFGGPDGGFILRWEQSNRSRSALGWPETIRYLEQKLTRCHTSNIPAVQADLDAARRAEGSTLFEIIVEIVREHGPGGRESGDNVMLQLV